MRRDKYKHFIYQRMHWSLTLIWPQCRIRAKFSLICKTTIRELSLTNKIQISSWQKCYKMLIWFRRAKNLDTPTMTPSCSMLPTKIKVGSCHQTKISSNKMVASLLWTPLLKVCPQDSSNSFLWQLLIVILSRVHLSIRMGYNSNSKSWSILQMAKWCKQMQTVIAFWRCRGSKNSLLLRARISKRLSISS